MVLNKRGSAFFYVFMVLFLIISILVMYSKFKITHIGIREKVVNESSVQEFLNDFEDRIYNNYPINIYEETIITDTFNGEVYTAKLTPPVNILVKAVEETIYVERDSLISKTINYDSNYNKQLLTFVENNLTNKTEKFLLSSNLFNNKVIYIGAGTEIDLEKDTKYSKVGFRKNSGELEIKNGYPTNNRLNLLSPNIGDIYDLYYMSENGEILKWNRFSYGSYTERKEDENTYHFIQVPNKDLRIRDDIPYNYSSYNDYILHTESKYDAPLDRNVVTTNLDLNLINNYTGEYEIDIKHRIYDNESLVNYSGNYIEGNQTYSIVDGLSPNGEIKLKQTISRNYPYTDKDLVHVYDIARQSETRKLNIQIENALITELTIRYKQYSSANFHLTVSDEKGKVIREKDLVISND